MNSPARHYLRGRALETLWLPNIGCGLADRTPARGRTLRQHGSLNRQVIRIMRWLLTACCVGYRPALMESRGLVQVIPSRCRSAGATQDGGLPHAHAWFAPRSRGGYSPNGQMDYLVPLRSSVDKHAPRLISKVVRTLTFSSQAETRFPMETSGHPNLPVNQT